MKNQRWTLALLAIGGAIVLLSARLRDPSAALKEREIRGDSGPGPSPGLTMSAAASPNGLLRGNLRVVILADGKAVPGASVTLLHEESHRQLDFDTQADGTERILSVPAGTYHLSVCHPQFVPASAQHRAEGGPAEEITIHLQRGARIEGTVIDWGGRALAGATILLVEPKIGAPIEHDLSAQTDASGRYVIDGVPAGTFCVRFRHDSHRSWATPELSVTAPGQRIHVDAVLEEGRRISGCVVNETGDPVAGALVVGSNGETVTGRSGETGRFALQGLGELPVYCFASAPGYGVAMLRNVAPGSSDLEFRLPRTATLSGQIETRPVPDRFSVQLSRFEPELGGFYPLHARAFEAAGGDAFQLPGISPGRYRLEIQADGFEAQNLPELDVTSGQSLSGLLVRLRKK